MQVSAGSSRRFTENLVQFNFIAASGVFLANPLPMMGSA